jgi:hypothetical protein
VTVLASELMAKQLELLHQVVPTVTVTAALANPTPTQCRELIEQLASSGPHPWAAARPPEWEQ